MRTKKHLFRGLPVDALVSDGLSVFYLVNFLHRLISDSRLLSIIIPEIFFWPAAICSIICPALRVVFHGFFGVAVAAVHHDAGEFRFQH
jgi:hypothetical protein